MLKPGLRYDFDTEQNSIQIMEYAMIGFFCSGFVPTIPQVIIFCILCCVLSNPIVL